MALLSVRSRHLMLHGQTPIRRRRFFDLSEGDTEKAGPKSTSPPWHKRSSASAHPAASRRYPPATRERYANHARIIHEPSMNHSSTIHEPSADCGCGSGAGFARHPFGSSSRILRIILCTSRYEVQSGCGGTGRPTMARRVGSAAGACHPHQSCQHVRAGTSCIVTVDAFLQIVMQMLGADRVVEHANIVLDRPSDFLDGQPARPPPIIDGQVTSRSGLVDVLSDEAKRAFGSDFS